MPAGGPPHPDAYLFFACFNLLHLLRASAAAAFSCPAVCAWTHGKHQWYQPCQSFWLSCRLTIDKVLVSSSG